MSERPARLPGDLPRAEQVRRMIRVDHAGEYGAARIYDGQLAVLGRSRAATPIRRMAEQEKHHLDVFERLLVERRVRPTLLSPLWHVAGFALGAATALLGEKAAMACTAAVESVIDEHYARQEAQLDAREAPLKAMVAQFRAEEREHHDKALEHGAESTPFYHILTTAIVYQTKMAIWLSTRF